MDMNLDEHHIWLEENFDFSPLPDDFELPSLTELALRGG